MLIASCTTPSGPYGAWLLSLMEDVPEAQRLTYIRVFQACGDLWQKEIEGNDLPDLFLRVIEAICFVELHLPANEADIKLHNLIHLAFSIGDWGE